MTNTDSNFADTTFHVEVVRQATANAVHMYGTDDNGNYWRCTFEQRGMDDGAFLLQLSDETNKKGNVIPLVSKYDERLDAFWVQWKGYTFPITRLFDWR
jgi:hypothetical protein